MLLLIILIVLLFPLFYLLLVPLWLNINTEKGVYKLNFGSLISMRLRQSATGFYLRLRIFFLGFTFRPGQQKEKQETHDREGTKKRRKRRFTLQRALRLLRTVRSSLYIKRFIAHIDTGDYPLNAQLIPLAQFASRKNIELHINFVDDNRLDCAIQTRLITLLWNYLVERIKSLDLLHIIKGLRIKN